MINLVSLKLNYSYLVITKETILKNQYSDIKSRLIEVTFTGGAEEAGQSGAFPAQNNPKVRGASENSIEKYCDCALELIVDESKNRRDSGYACALENFG